MESIQLNGYHIYDYIVSGAKQIIRNEKQLNEINVFPVADGDTGSNLAFTMNSIIANSERNRSVDVTLNSISDAAIEASFGNSGTIIAKYFYGMSQTSKGKAVLTIDEFIETLNDSVRYAYDAISHPQEGTILTVMREWGQYLKKEQNQYHTFDKLVNSSLHYAYEVLDKTKTLLKVLSEADVVDAGAKGFVCFIEGLHSFIATGVISEKNTSRVEKIDHEKISHSVKDLNYQYCTEITVEGIGSEISSIKQLVDSYGDSAIVNRYNDQIRIHVHTDRPHVLATELSEIGRITDSKVDNMKIQQDIVHNRKYKIALLTDSIADLPDEFIEGNQIYTIPLIMIHNGSVYLDKYTTNATTIFNTLKQSSNYPKSSQPNEKFIEKSMRFLLEHYDEVIGITISSKMSGTHERMMQTAKRLSVDGKRIEIIDSCLNSGAEGLLAKNAMDLIKSGLNFDEIVDKLYKIKKNISIFVKIPDLNYAAKSGRVPKVAGMVAASLGIKPMISIDKDGNGTVLKEFNIKKLINRTAKENKIEEYVIVHTDNTQKAKELSEYAENLLGFPPLYIESVSSIVSAFIGRGAYGIAFKEVSND
jgi:hypothetical protein